MNLLPIKDGCIANEVFDVVLDIVDLYPITSKDDSLNDNIQILINLIDKQTNV